MQFMQSVGTEDMCVFLLVFVCTPTLCTHACTDTDMHAFARRVSERERETKTGGSTHDSV